MDDNRIGEWPDGLKISDCINFSVEDKDIVIYNACNLIDFLYFEALHPESRNEIEIKKKYLKFYEYNQYTINDSKMLILKNVLNITERIK